MTAIIKYYTTSLGLVKVYSEENGVIWDTPDKEFLTAFEGMGDEIKEIG